MPDVDDLVNSLPEAQAGSRCWASDLEEEANAFLEGVREREEQGVKLLRGAIRDVLKREFDITIGDEALRKHILRRCRCE